MGRGLEICCAGLHFRVCGHGPGFEFSETLISLEPSDPTGFLGGAFGGLHRKCDLVFE